MAHPSFGPISPEEFAKLRDAPAGAAIKAIHKHDPLWGRERKAGERQTWKVSLRRSVRAYEEATLEIEAVDAAEAEKLADKMDWDTLTWRDAGYDADPDDYEIRDVTPA